MSKNDLALKIGLHILKTIDECRFAQKLVVPLKIPHTSDEPEWIYSIELRMPTYSYVTTDDNGERTWKHVTMAEYYGWEKKGEHE
jgi:hypothetical protein